MHTRLPPVAIPLFFAVLTAMVIFFLILPTVGNIKQINRFVAEQRSTLDQLYEQGINIKRTTKNLETARRAVPILEKAFLTNGNELAFIEALEQLARQHTLLARLDLETMDTQPTSKNKKPDKTGYTVRIVRIDLEGSYSDITAFLQDLTQLEFMISVFDIAIDTAQPQGTYRPRNKIPSFPPSLSIQPDSAATPPPTKELTARLTARTYWK